MPRRIELGPLERLAPHARTHPADQAAQIAAWIAEFGFLNPIPVDSRDGLAAGPGRRASRAWASAGGEEVAGLTPETEERPAEAGEAETPLPRAKAVTQPGRPVAHRTAPGRERRWRGPRGDRWLTGPDRAVSGDGGGQTAVAHESGGGQVNVAATPRPDRIRGGWRGEAAGGHFAHRGTGSPRRLH